jgi:hypothetical protein
MSRSLVIVGRIDDTGFIAQLDSKYPEAVTARTRDADTVETAIPNDLSRRYRYEMAHYRHDYAERPGTITEIRGIVFQNDGQSMVGRVFIRPMEALDRWVARVVPERGDPPLAIHAGIHVVIDGSQEYVAEQLVGSLYLDFRNGLNWTPFDHFRQRDRGGWDATVPATIFRGIDAGVVHETVERLNTIQGHPFIGEDCTAFVERAFGNRRMFADSPLLRWFGIAVRIGDPALPLFRPDAQLDEPARTNLEFDTIRELPDATADVDSTNARIWAHRFLPIALLTLLLVQPIRRLRAGRLQLRAPRVSS